MKRLNLKANPYRVFRQSATPPGLYARQKWLQEGATAGWRNDFSVTVAALYRGHGADGLWHGSALETIHRLFGLHLTVRAADARIHHALDRLLAQAASPEGKGRAEWIDADRLAGLPLAPGPRQPLVVSAALFLATIFGRGADEAVLDLYGGITSTGGRAAAERMDPPLFGNRLRALVVHPRYAVHEATEAMVDLLARRQTPRGDWGEAMPFFQTLNALAHLSLPSAEAQCQKAFALVAQTQQADGTWGQAEPEWCTFLTLHALRNKGAI